MRCDQCRHWNEGGEVEGSRVYTDLGLCKRPMQLWDATEWVKDGDICEPDYYRVRTEVAAQTKAFVQDGSDYRANLFTAADFFCAHFEEI